MRTHVVPCCVHVATQRCWSCHAKWVRPCLRWWLGVPLWSASCLRYGKRVSHPVDVFFRYRNLSKFSYMISHGKDSCCLCLTTECKHIWRVNRDDGETLAFSAQGVWIERTRLLVQQCVFRDPTLQRDSWCRNRRHIVTCRWMQNSAKLLATLCGPHCASHIVQRIKKTKIGENQPRLYQDPCRVPTGTPKIPNSSVL